MTVPICRQLQRLFSCEKSTFSEAYFLRHSKDIASLFLFLFFFLRGAGGAGGAGNLNIPGYKQETLMFICMQTIKFISLFFLKI